MKKLEILALCAFIAGIMISCQNNETIDELEPEVSKKLTKEQEIALAAAGVNPYAAEIITRIYPDGTSAEGILAGSDKEGYKDVFIKLVDLENQALPIGEGEEQTKQYRTRNLVSQGRTINVVGYTGGRFALTSRMRTGLQRAVANYNNINNMSLTFNLRFAATTNADMVVYNGGGTAAGGSAEFPSGGRPGKFIQLLGGLQRFSLGVNEHVITHEMGHAVGFRHTDYARRRCDNANEGTAGSIGAIYIPGTERGNEWPNTDRNSIMISCFDSGESGNFGAGDIRALQFMY